MLALMFGIGSELGRLYTAVDREQIDIIIFAISDVYRSTFCLPRAYRALEGRIDYFLSLRRLEHDSMYTSLSPAYFTLYFTFTLPLPLLYLYSVLSLLSVLYIPYILLSSLIHFSV